MSNTIWDGEKYWRYDRVNKDYFVMNQVGGSPQVSTIPPDVAGGRVHAHNRTVRRAERRDEWWPRKPASEYGCELKVEVPSNVEPNVVATEDYFDVPLDPTVWLTPASAPMLTTERINDRLASIDLLSGSPPVVSERPRTFTTVDWDGF